MKKLDIFSFAMVQPFVTAALNHLFKEWPNIPQKEWAIKLDIKHPSLLNNIIKGRRKAPMAMGLKIAKLLELSTDETYYLQLLMLIESTRSKDQRAIFLAQKNELIEKKNMLSIELEKFKLISEWYPFLLLEALSLKNAQKLKQFQLADLFLMPLSPIDVTTSLQRMEKLGLIAKDSRGHYYRTKNVPFFAGQNIPSEVVQNYHLQGMELAKLALSKNKFEERSFSGINVPILKSDVSKLFSIINSFNEQVLALAHPKDADVIYRINVQAFKATKS